MFLIKNAKQYFKNKYRNWTADIALRYLPIVKAINYEGIQDSLILEVGSGSLGITPYLKKSVVGVDQNFIGPQTSRLKKVYSSAVKLPFRNKSFDYVVCVDLLEHIKLDLRKKVIEELFRVGKKTIFIAFPYGDTAIEEDVYTKQLFLREMGYHDPFIEEHLDYQLPDKKEILNLLKNYGEVEIIENINITLHRYLMKTQISKKKHINFISAIINVMLLPLFSKINMGNYYRVIFVVRKKVS